MEDTTLHAPEDQAVFQRVWERVMGDRPPEHSPIQVDAPAKAEPAMAAGLPAAAPIHCPPAPAPEEPPSHTTRLRQFILEALTGWQFYRHLARRARGSAVRTLTAMAGELHRQAKSLAAAYFLLTGMRYWPTEQLAAPAIPSYWGALRSRHQAEQQFEQALRKAAAQHPERPLPELYLELADSADIRQRQLRTLLEQSCS